MSRTQTPARPARPAAPAVAAPVAPARPAPPAAAVAASTPAAALAAARAARAPASPAATLAEAVQAHADVAARPARPARPGAQATAAAPSAPAVERSLAAALAAADAEIAKLKAALAAAPKAAALPPHRTEAQILEGAPELPEGDWRNAFIGQTFTLCDFDEGREGSLRKKQAVLVMLGAVPRDSDLALPNEKLAAKPSLARAEGRLACHYARNERGEYVMPPLYLSESDVSALWPD